MVILNVVLAHPHAVAAVLLAAACAGPLGWIVLLLRADARRPAVVRARAVVRRPAPPAAGPDRPLVNPRFAAYIAARSAEFAAAHRTGRPPRPVPIGVDVSGRHATVAAAHAAGRVRVVWTGEMPR